jgi:hypothetical protein
MPQIARITQIEKKLVLRQAQYKKYGNVNSHRLHGLHRWGINDEL